MDQAATTVVTEMGHIRGLNEITQAFDKAEIGLILATSVCKLHKYSSFISFQDGKTVMFVAALILAVAVTSVGL